MSGASDNRSRMSFGMTTRPARSMTTIMVTIIPFNKTVESGPWGAAVDGLAGFDLGHVLHRWDSHDDGLVGSLMTTAKGAE